MEFMSDVLYGGPRFRTFNVIDEYDREAIAIEIDTPLRGERLIRLLEPIKCVFQRNPATDSTAKLSPIPVNPAAPWRGEFPGPAMRTINGMFRLFIL